jgi:hypothetical protein
VRATRSWSIPIKEDQRLAIIGRDGFERAPDERFFLLAHRLLSGTGARARQLRVQRIGLPGGGAHLAAPGVMDEIAGDAAEPALEPAWFLQGGKILPGGDEGILREVLAALDIAAGAVGDAANQ